MTKTVRARYTLEFKQEAVRLVTWGAEHGGGGQIAGCDRADAVHPKGSSYPGAGSVGGGVGRPI
jgi:hypothetical protein